jgi:hypothetical protein
LALTGAVVLIVFVMMRVATFEHVGMPNLGDYFNAMVELAGIACVAGGAWRSQRREADVRL